MVNIPELMNSY